MRIVPLDEITIPERIRKEIDSNGLAKLMESISSRGLFHPVVTRMEEGKLVLVAGETRLRAITQLHMLGTKIMCGVDEIPSGHIAITDFGELPPDEALEIELHENIIRVDLPWQMRVDALARLHKLRQSQHPNWNKSDTVREVRQMEPGEPITNKGITQVTDSLLLAAHMGDERVKKAPTQKRALKIVSEILEKKFAEKLAAQQPKQEEKLRLFTEDAIVWMKQQEPEQYDIILTDPPYGQGAHNIDAGMTTRANYKDTWDSASSLIASFAQLSYHLAKPQAHLYMFCNVRLFFMLEPLFLNAGWDVWTRPLIWVKDQGHTAMADWGPSYRYEAIMYAIKGQKMVVKTMQPDVLQYPLEKDREHQAQKPVELYVDLLRRSTLDGLASVLDPFAGSGTIFEAAQKLDLHADGCEIEPSAIAACHRRLERIKK